MKVSEGSSFLWLISHALAFVFFSPSRTIFMVKLSSASRSPPFKGRGRGGVCIILSTKKLPTPPLPLPCMGGERLRDGYDGRLARYGRWARSLRTVGSLVADGGLARCGRSARSLRTDGTLIADGALAHRGRTGQRSRKGLDERLGRAI